MNYQHWNWFVARTPTCCECRRLWLVRSDQSTTVHRRMENTRTPRRLSLASWVGWRRSALISALIIVSHVSFMYAQWGGQDEDCGFQDPKTLVLVGCPTDRIEPNGLLAGVIKLHVEFDASSVAGTALEVLSDDMCYAKGRYVDCSADRRTPILAANESMADTLCTLLECNGGNVYMPVIHVSYWYSLTHLWVQVRLHACAHTDIQGHVRCNMAPVLASHLSPLTLTFQPGPTDPPGCNIFHDPVNCTTDSYPGRPAASALFAFSFIWPHVKLILLHLFFYLPMSPGEGEGEGEG